MWRIRIVCAHEKCVPSCVPRTRGYHASEFYFTRPTGDNKTFRRTVKRQDSRATMNARTRRFSEALLHREWHIYYLLAMIYCRNRSKSIFPKKKNRKKTRKTTLFDVYYDKRHKLQYKAQLLQNQIMVTWLNTICWINLFFMHEYVNLCHSRALRALRYRPSIVAWRWRFRRTLHRLRTFASICQIDANCELSNCELRQIITRNRR